jgi:hypothetical protein
LQEHVLLFEGLLSAAADPLLRSSFPSEHPQGACANADGAAGCHAESNGKWHSAGHTGSPAGADNIKQTCRLADNPDGGVNARRSARNSRLQLPRSGPWVR